MHDPDDREDPVITAFRETAPVIKTCPDSGAEVKDCRPSVKCVDCGASWPDEETFKADTGKQ